MRYSMNHKIDPLKPQATQLQAETGNVPGNEKYKKNHSKQLNTIKYTSKQTLQKKTK
jgi:hypothetical protein